MTAKESRKLSDEYEVADILGKGGFSVVRRGSHVAIKTLKRFGSTPPEMPRNRAGEKGLASLGFPMWKQVSISNALLTNEILFMRKIVENVSSHPNVIHLHDVYEDLNGVHLASGGELFDRITAQDKYNKVDTKALANIVHHDLKPENCLFHRTSKDSPLKIMDFGLFGSIDYVSPEALSQAKISAASDMWSLGVILYILFSGYPLFHAILNRRKQQLILGDFSFDDHSWKTISSSAKHLISSLLTVDPHRRPTAQQILQHPWVTGDSAKQDLMDAEVVSRLHSFNARRKFRAAAIASVVSSTFFLRTKKLKNLLGSHDLTPDEIGKLMTHFKKICTKGDNATISEFEEVLKAMGMSSLAPLATRIFDLFDHNRDGTVDMREIICGFQSLRSSQGDEALQLCFQMYDTDKSGCISKEEVASMFRALPEDCLPADITEPGKLDEIFERMDANSYGKVTFDELKAAMQRDSSLQDVVLSYLRPL
ncbi:hypothetical protein MKX01_001289 [Papaver californicum]|nr:hypothetical protein MKX01_001289 [Papaver californicum]